MLDQLFTNAQVIDTTTLDAFSLLSSKHKSENLAASVTEGYRRTIELWRQRWPTLTIYQVQPHHVREFIIWLQGRDEQHPFPKVYKTATIHLHFRNMRAFLRFCREEGLFEHDPLRNVKAPKLEYTLPDVLTEYEAAKILRDTKATGDRHCFRDYVIQFFYLKTGMRLSELASLNIDDVHLDGCFCRVNGKGRRQRLVPMGDLLPLEVRRYILKIRRAPLGEKALFLNEYGKRLQARGIKSLVKRAMGKHLHRKINRAGPHTYRHSACTFLLRELKDLKRVSIIMGHASVETTERYVHLTFGDVVNGNDHPSLESLLKANRSRVQPRPSPIPELETRVRT
jgi:integrase/recombinase XerD